MTTKIECFEQFCDYAKDDERMAAMLELFEGRFADIEPAVYSFKSTVWDYEHGMENYEAVEKAQENANQTIDAAFNDIYDLDPDDYLQAEDKSYSWGFVGFWYNEWPEITKKAAEIVDRTYKWPATVERCGVISVIIQRAMDEYTGSKEDTPYSDYCKEVAQLLIVLLSKKFVYYWEVFKYEYDIDCEG